VTLGFGEQVAEHGIITSRPSLINFLKGGLAVKYGIAGNNSNNFEINRRNSSTLLFFNYSLISRLAI
jgi:hypothetical protein